MELPSQNVNNFMVWSHHLSGQFTKTAYARLIMQQPPVPILARAVQQKVFKVL